MLKWGVLIGGVILAAGLLAFCDGIAAAIDNVLGLRTRSDTRMVQMQRVGAMTLVDLIGPEAEWTAYHRDELWRTFVDCRVKRDGGEQAYHWEVVRGFSPRDGYAERDGVFITPLTRDTGHLAPSLVPSGLRAEQLPQGPFTSARAIYQGAGLAPDVPLPATKRH